MSLAFYENDSRFPFYVDHGIRPPLSVGDTVMIQGRCWRVTHSDAVFACDAYLRQVRAVVTPDEAGSPLVAFH